MNTNARVTKLRPRGPQGTTVKQALTRFDNLERGRIKRAESLKVRRMIPTLIATFEAHRVTARKR